MTVLSDRCVEVLDITAAGIMLAAHDGQLRVMTSSSDMMRMVELFEVQSREGPCLDCYRTGQPVVNNDLASAHGRWPRFSVVAVDAGFSAVDAIPMRLRGQVIGALNLFSTETASLAADDVAVAQALADIATIAILQHRMALRAQLVNEQLNYALASCIIIEQAKGMVAQRAKVDVDEAFAQLRYYARNRNMRLAELARSIVDGAVDPAELDDPRW